MWSITHAKNIFFFASKALIEGDIPVYDTNGSDIKKSKQSKKNKDGKILWSVHKCFFIVWGRVKAFYKDKDICAARLDMTWD